MQFLNKLKETIRQNSLIDLKDTVLIGVSGGPDSVALLYALKALQKELRLSLHIAHLNHMLRGQESKADADFVLCLAKKLELPVSIKEIDSSRRSLKGSQEEISRKARLSFLFATAKKVKADKIALGHNKDDQSETVMMRLLRGSGLLGLSGILPKRKIEGFTVIRPLIGIPRRDIERFLKARRIQPRRDLSNLDEAYFRNRIRHRLLPELKKYNSNITEVLANTAENVGLDYDYLLTQGKKAFKDLRAKISKASLRLDSAKLLEQHPAVQNMIFRLGYEMLKGDTRRLTYQHIRELKGLLFNRPNGAVVDLPSGICVTKNKNLLSFARRSQGLPRG